MNIRIMKICKIGVEKIESLEVVLMRTYRSILEVLSVSEQCSGTNSDVLLWSGGILRRNTQVTEFREGSHLTRRGQKKSTVRYQARKLEKIKTEIE